MQEQSTLTIVVLALATVFLVDNGKDVAVWLSCAFRGDCSENGLRDTQLVGMMVGSLIALALGTWAAQAGKKTRGETLVILCTTFLSALFAIFKASVGDGHYPLRANFWDPLVIWMLCAVIYVAIYSSGREEGQRGWIAGCGLIMRASLAFVVSLIVGGLVQLVLGGNSNSGHDFVIAPMAVSGGGALFIAAMLDPWVREQGRHTLRLVLWPLLGLVAVFAFLHLVYWEKHGTTWITDSKSPFSVVVAMSSVLLVGLVVTAIVFASRHSGSVKGNVIVAAFVAAPIAGVAGYWLATLRFSSGSSIWHISVAHALATAIAIAGAVVVPLVMRSLGERFQVSEVRQTEE